MIPAPVWAAVCGAWRPRSVARAAATPGADRYRKHFPASAHLWILLFHVLDGAASLRQTHARLAAVPRCFAASGCGVASAAPSWPAPPPAAIRPAPSACSPRRWPRCAGGRLTRSGAGWRGSRSWTAPSWRSPPRSAPGARTAATPPACGCSRLRPGRRHPVGAAADPRRHPRHHRAARARPGALAGWTLLIDLGYYGHRLFAELRAAGASLICRLHPQAAYVIAADHPVPPITTPDGDVVLADQTITLGSPTNRAGAVLPGMRLITSRNPRGEVQRFVTDRVRPLRGRHRRPLPQALADRALLPLAQAPTRARPALRPPAAKPSGRRS